MKTKNLLSSSCLGVALLASAPLSAQTYTTQPIQPPPGTVSCSGDALNNAGVVLGRTTVRVSSGKKATTVRGPGFLWADGVSVVLPPLASQPEAEGTAISDTGLPVGGLTIFTDVASGRATWWEQVGNGYAPRDWNDLVPVDWNVTLLRAVAISADGQYVGFSADTGGTELRDIVVRVELDSTGTIPVALQEYWDLVEIWGLCQVRHNGNGLVLATGLGGPDVTEPGAWLWVKEGASDPVLLDLHPPSESLTGAWDVNSHGEMAGFRRNSGIDRATVWNATGVMLDIDTLGGTEAVAFSINDLGHVVGWSSGAKGKNSGQRAFHWDGNSMVDLNTRTSSGTTLTSGRKINNVGQILCWGGGGSVLLTPQ